jgi:hypothetical protein
MLTIPAQTLPSAETLRRIKLLSDRELRALADQYGSLFD